MKFIEKELNAGMELDFGDFVLFNGKKKLQLYHMMTKRIAV